MYCRHCGQQIEGSPKFCPNCGKSQTASGGNSSNLNNLNELVGNLDVNSLVNKLKCNLKAVIIIALSVVILFTSKMDWITLDVWVASGGGNLFELFDIVDAIRRYGGDTLGSGATCCMLLIYGAALVATGLHVESIYSILKKGRSETAFIPAGAIASGIVSLIVFLIVLLLNAQLKSALGNYFDVSPFSVGFGPILCLIFSVAQAALCLSLEDTRTFTPKHADWVNSENAVTCPYCGTKYVRNNALTACPNCHKKIDEQKKKEEAKRKAEQVTCPFCHVIYPAGTVFCKICMAKIGTDSNETQPKSVPVPPKADANVLPTPPVDVAMSKQPESKTASTKTEVRYCHSCGKEILHNAAFCSFCGTAQLTQ